MQYACALERNGKRVSWTSSISLFRHEADVYEAEISGRDSCFRVIVGIYVNGFYICIPGMGIGSELSVPEDVFWNYERLSRSLGSVDATTVSEGLKYLRRIECEGIV